MSVDQMADEERKFLNADIELLPDRIWIDEVQATNKHGDSIYYVSPATSDPVEYVRTSSGSVCVPVEPTEEMIEAAVPAIFANEDNYVEARGEVWAVYKAMIAAIPTQEHIVVHVLPVNSEREQEVDELVAEFYRDAEITPFRQHLKDCKALVETWPQWKQHLLTTIGEDAALNDSPEAIKRWAERLAQDLFPSAKPDRGVSDDNP